MLVGAIDWNAVGTIAAVVVSTISLILSWRGGREASKARQGMVSVQRDMAQALGRIADAQEGQREGGLRYGDDRGADGEDEGGLPSVRLPHGDSRLVIENIGREPIKIVDFQVLGQPEIIVTGGGDPRDTELFPGESTTVLVAITFGTDMPLEVLTTWQDSTGVHDRIQRVGWS